jgi:hypothetical protein
MVKTGKRDHIRKYLIAGDISGQKILQEKSTISRLMRLSVQRHHTRLPDQMERSP